MRLYLSSYHVGGAAERLRALVRPPGRTLVVTNAHDLWTDTMAAALSREIDDLEQLGFRAAGLDLRDYFGEQERLASTMADADLVWVKGGNTFTECRSVPSQTAR